MPCETQATLCPAGGGPDQPDRLARGGRRTPGAESSPARSAHSRRKSSPGNTPRGGRSFGRGWTPRMSMAGIWPQGRRTTRCESGTSAPERNGSSSQVSAATSWTATPNGTRPSRARKPLLHTPSPRQRRSGPRRDKGFPQGTDRQDAAPRRLPRTATGSTVIGKRASRRPVARFGQIARSNQGDARNLRRTDTPEELRADGCGRPGYRAGLLTLDCAAGQRLARRTDLGRRLLRRSPPGCLPSPRAL
jgi:hypothetical protein